MKNVAVIFLILAVILQSFTHGLIVCAFKANQNYIARNLCINRNKPKLKCGGRCQLMKKMSAQNEDSNNSSLKFEILPFVFESSFSVAVFKIDNNLQHTAYYILSPARIIPSDIFHPPLNG